MKTDAKSRLKGLYQALADRPLKPDDPFYVPYMADNHSEPDPVSRIFTDITFSESSSLQMVSGQRGTGKSTEFLRLKHMLEEDDYIVFYVDILDYIHSAEPVEISDFLLSSTLAIAQAAEKNYGLKKVHENYLERLKDFLLSEVKLEEISLKTGIDEFGADIKMRLKRDDTFKKRLQTVSRGHISRLVDDSHRFIVNLVTTLRDQFNNPDQQVVFIIDSFEQIRGHNTNAHDVHNSIVQLFSTHGKNLRFPMLHMVITVPPYLNSAAPGVAAILGSTPPIMWPSIHTRHRQNDNNKNNHDEKGLSILTRIISQRSEDINQLFKEEDLRQLAIASGGEIRIMFILVRAALTINGANLDRMELPTSPQVIQQAFNQVKRSMLPITDEDVRKLFHIHQSKQAELENIAELPELARLFDFNLVINYRNGEDWYDILPMIEDYVLERQKVLDERVRKEVDE